MRNNGFTLIELVVVVVLLSILAAIALPQFVDLSDSTRIAVNKAVAGSLKSGINLAQSTLHMQSPGGTTLVNYGADSDGNDGTGNTIVFSTLANGTTGWPVFAVADGAAIPTVPSVSNPLELAAFLAGSTIQNSCQRLATTLLTDDSQVAALNSDYGAGFWGLLAGIAFLNGTFRLNISTTGITEGLMTAISDLKNEGATYAATGYLSNGLLGGYPICLFIRTDGKLTNGDVPYITYDTNTGTVTASQDTASEGA